MEMFAYHRYHTKQSIVTTIREEKEMKEIQIGKEEVKLLLFTGDMILYTKILNMSPRKLLELMKELSKV